MLRAATLRVPWPWLLSVAVLAGCRNHVLNEGSYRLTPGQVLRDDCGLVQTTQAQWTGLLRILGDVVWFDVGLFGVEMRGQYRDNQESFLLDGSAANVDAPVNGQTCLVKAVNLHLDGISDSRTSFHGTFTLQYNATPATSPAALGCTCQMWATYQAVAY